MSKISNFQEFTKENFPSKYQDLCDVISNPFNNFGRQITNALNNNQITVGDNLNEQYKTITVTVDATGAPVQTCTYKSTLSTKTVGIVVISATNVTSSNTYPTAAPFCSWIDQSGSVTISNISGLQANNQYTLVLRTMG